MLLQDSCSNSNVAARRSHKRIFKHTLFGFLPQSLVSLSDMFCHEVIFCYAFPSTSFTINYHILTPLPFHFTPPPPSKWMNIIPTSYSSSFYPVSRLRQTMQSQRVGWFLDFNILPTAHGENTKGKAQMTTMDRQHNDYSMKFHD